VGKVYVDALEMILLNSDDFTVRGVIHFGERTQAGGVLSLSLKIRAEFLSALMDEI
jgi:hypothetical protein